MLIWLNDRRIQTVLGRHAIEHLRPVVAMTLLYMVVRTWIALKDPPRMKWEYVFPPIDVLVISLILYLSNRGPMSNLSLLFFLPIVEAAGSLKVRWSAAVGLMVVAGQAFSTYSADNLPNLANVAMAELWRQEPLNVVFRLFFLVLISSLMGYQAVIAAELKEKLGVAADRNRIALEMHDGVQGSLINLASSLELISHVAPNDGAKAAEIARDSRETARQAADELRFLVQRLRGPALTQGFIPALRQYAHNICERRGLRLEFTVDGEERSLHADIENALFRIAQESLNNIVKHADACRVDLSVAFEPEHLRLRVKDDGKGFDPGRIEENVGLQSMQERVSRLGGSLAVSSMPGVGTEIVAKL